ncbi:MAG: hypothetical protein H6625_13775 [Bdellovibrionaceae bacterium]|nr:hypothetical protein [Pseudobdellovibrionaceae bacterium]
MKTPFPEATRIEWEVDDPVLFFQHLRSFFWQIESPTLFQIEEDLKNDFDCCVFEDKKVPSSFLRCGDGFGAKFCFLYNNKR